VDPLAHQLLEPGLVVDRGVRELDVERAGELRPDAAGRLRRRPLAEQAALEDDHVAVAERRQVIGDRDADDPAADDDDTPAVEHAHATPALNQSINVTASHTGTPVAARTASEYGGRLVHSKTNA